MKCVYIVLKHPRHPFHGGYLAAGELKGVFGTRKEALAMADKKNSKRPLGLYAVHRKQIQGAEA